jgi:hypothetical protein
MLLTTWTTLASSWNGVAAAALTGEAVAAVVDAVVLNAR